jgi:hypothetical protein
VAGGARAVAEEGAIRRRTSIFTMMLTVILAALPVAAGPTLDATAYEEIVEQGFGDEDNTLAWSMAWWNDKLYVGTARAHACVQAAAIETALPWTNTYPPAEDNVDCTEDVVDLDLRSEIWRWTPESDLWELMYVAPVDVEVPGQPGRFISRDIGYRSMLVFTEPDGTEALYVAGVSARDYLPGSAPPRLLRSTDGVQFDEVPHDPGTFLGDTEAIGYRTLTEFKGRLLVVASRALLGHGAVYESADPAAGNDSFRKISPNHWDAFELAAYNDHLYVGYGANIFDVTAGPFNIYKTDGEGSLPLQYTALLPPGGGRPGIQSRAVTSMWVWNDRLYFGTDRPAELYRINPDDSWDLIVGEPRFLGTEIKEPLSGMRAGFDDAYNIHMWRMIDHDGWMLVGTMDQKTKHRNTPGLGEQLEPRMGFDLYATPDGRNYTAITTTGFGDKFDVGVRNFLSRPDGLIFGTSNHYEGLRLYRETPGPSIGAPGSVEVENASPVPVLTWSPVDGAESYDVYRSVLGEGIPTLLGSSDDTVFDDATTSVDVEYHYWVRAIAGDGEVSAPSNVARYPDLAPTVTFNGMWWALQRTLGPNTLSGFLSNGAWQALRGKYDMAHAKLDELQQALANDPGGLTPWQVEDVSLQVERLRSRLTLAELGWIPAWAVVW